MRALRPDAQVVGVEIDADRVAAARPFAGPGLSFVRGGFELPVAGQPVLVRAFNVLRQYDEQAAARAWDTMRARLAPDGVLVEGTCDELGRRLVGDARPVRAPDADPRRAARDPGPAVGPV